MKIALLLLFISLSFHCFASQNGKLLIVGGALSRDNASIYQAFLDARPKQKGDIAIIPAASGSPSKNAKRFKDDLIHYGVDAKQIHILPIAVVDDRSTEDVDESAWIGNANQARLVEVLASVEAFWFIGGDQLRIIEALRPQKNKPTKLYTLLQKKLAEGAVIGGTSAGAAMMSDPMIAGGDSFSAIVRNSARHFAGDPEESQGELYLHHGLGFFPFGLTDQHFDRRARLGRLIRALADSKIGQGFAVDEDTGMLVDLASKQIKVLGRGSVTLVDTSKAAFTGKPFSAKSVRISSLAPNDIYLISEARVVLDQSKGEIKSVLGREYNGHAVIHGAGLAFGSARLSALLGSELVDNSEASEIRRYNFNETGEGFYFRFFQDRKTDAFWRHIDGTREQYTIIDAGVDIQPARVTVNSEISPGA